MAFTNLLVLGDSISYGAYATLFSKSYRRLLATHYGATLLGDNFTKYNLPYLINAWPAYSGLGAEVIIVEVGINDVIGFGPNVGDIAEIDWQAAYANLLTNMLATGAIVVATTPFASVRPPHIQYDKMERYNDYIRNAAFSTGAILADVYPVTIGISQYLSQPGDVSEIAPGFTGDNFHPGDAGHAKIADVIVNALSFSDEGTDNMNNCTSVCCVNGTTPTPDPTADISVCNAGKGAIFIGTTGQRYIRMALTTPCASNDWEPLNGSIVASSGLVTFSPDVLTGPTAVVFQEFAERATIIVVNPSSRNSMAVMISGDITIDLAAGGVAEPAATFAFDSRIYVNGVAQGTRNAGIIDHILGAGDYFEFCSHNGLAFTIAPGATVTIELAGIYSAATGFEAVTMGGTAHLSAIGALV